MIRQTDIIIAHIPTRQKHSVGEASSVRDVPKGEKAWPKESGKGQTEGHRGPNPQLEVPHLDLMDKCHL